jgi:hypothetical protein
MESLLLPYLISTKGRHGTMAGINEVTADPSTSLRMTTFLVRQEQRQQQEQETAVARRFQLAGDYGEFCCLPGCDAAGQFDQIRDAVLVEDAGGDRGAIASGAVDCDSAVAGDFVEAFLELGEREVDAAGEVSGAP